MTHPARCIILLAAALLGASATVRAIDLTTYYSKANGKKGADLKTAMYGIITNHTNIGYDGLLDAYHTTDRRADGFLRDWYSNATNYVIGGSAENRSYKAEGDSYNREHTVPQSWFGSTSLMKSDLVQVVPTDGYVNNRRGNYPLGENKGESYKSANAYSKVGACTVSGYTGQCFEPNDEIKGDMARIYFYVLTCYENAHPGWNGGTASQFFDGKKYPGLKDWALQMLLRWAQQDPVDEVERARNEAVYQIQKNRNPFVDYPSLCEFVWGDSVSYAFDVSLPHGQKKTDDTDPQPVNPDPVNPDPVNPDPVNPTGESGTIEFSKCNWAATTHPTYGSGFTATANGLTVGYYTYNSTNTVINTGSEVRLYKGAVLLIEGAEVTGAVLHAADSKLAAVEIDGKTLTWQNSTITWAGSLQPFLVTATGGQSRIASIDVTVATPSPDFYHSVQGLNQAALKTALHDLMQPRSVLSYGGKGEDYTWAGFAAADVMDGGVVRDRYSDELRMFKGLQAVEGMHIEHIWANSWWGHTVNHAYCDLFNLFPADATANGRKSNNPIGVVDGTVAFDNGVTKVGKSSSYRADSLITAWEPADEWKGDFARTYFYMATTYQHMAGAWQTTEGLLTVDPSSWQTMRPWVYELMLQWAAEDPVDDIERERNEVIYSIQGNRNPYVDIPELSDYVWGEKSQQVFYVDPASTTPELFVPVRDSTLDFGLQALSLEASRSIVVRGRNLPTGLTATIEGDGFYLPPTSLSAAEVTRGARLTVSSHAASAGEYAATLVLRSEDFYEQRTPLRMTVIDGVPAYPARNIVCLVNSRSFMATWMDMHLKADEHYTLDVYTKDAAGGRQAFGTYPLELTDTFCLVRNPAASTTYYYQVHTSAGLVSNEVRVDMPAITPVFSASSSEMFFAAVPDTPSLPQGVKVTALGFSGQYTVLCPAPFEVSTDGEAWEHVLTLTPSQSSVFVRFSGMTDEGTYEGELTLSLPGVKDIFVELTANVDVTKAFFESFELGSKNSYAEGIVACNTGEWAMQNALLAADANRNDGRCVRMKIGGSLTMQDDKLGGCDSLWFYAGLYNKDTGVTLTVSYSQDGGAQWNPVVTDLAFNSGEWKRYGYAVKRDGPVRLKFETQAGTQNKRLNIDDIQMSDYGTQVSLEDVEWSYCDAPVAIYTLDGRYVGDAEPSRPGIYIVRKGSRVWKMRR